MRTFADDDLGLAALEDGFAAPTLEALGRARATDDELVAIVAARLGPLESWRVERLSPAERTVLARLERAAR